MFCPICQSEKLKKITVETQEADCKKNLTVFECENCRVLFAEDYRKERKNIYDDNYAAWRKSEDKIEKEIAHAKIMAFKSQIKEIEKLINLKNKKIIDIGTGNGYLLEALKNLGCNCYGTEISEYSAEVSSKKFPGKIFEGELKNAEYKNEFFDVIFLTDVLEHLNNPSETISEARRILKSDGLIFIISPNAESITRKIFGKRWFQFKYEHIFYFNRKSLNYLLQKEGFEIIKFRNNWKKFNLRYYHSYFEKYSFFGIGNILRIVYPILPSFVKDIPIPNFITGEFLAIAKKNN